MIRQDGGRYLSRSSSSITTNAFSCPGSKTPLSVVKYGGSVESEDVGYITEFKCEYLSTVSGGIVTWGIHPELIIVQMSTPRSGCLWIMERRKKWRVKRIIAGRR